MRSCKFSNFIMSPPIEHFFGTDFTDFTDFVWVPAKGCLWTRKDLSFYLDTFSEVYQEADFHAGGFQVVDELGAVCRVKVFYGLEFEEAEGVVDFVGAGYYFGG